MTEREEIDMLRRQVADLMERVRALEARPMAPTYIPLAAAVSPYTAPYKPLSRVTTCTTIRAYPPAQSWS